MINWQPTIENPNFATHNLHIYKIPLDVEPSTNYQKIFSPDELERAQQFKFDKHKKRFINARYALRTTLSKYLQIEPSEIIFHYNENGKPFIKSSQNIQFNLSHSAELALLVVTCEISVGIDIELIDVKRVNDDIAKRFFSKNEVQQYLQLTQTERQRAFFDIWTRKEAYIKAKGRGIANSLDKFSVSADPFDANLLASEFEEDINNWQLLSFDINAAYIAAVAMNTNKIKPLLLQL